MWIRAKWSVVAAVLVVGVAYGAYPYVTLYRLGQAIQASDSQTLESLVNWPAVREGIKEDVCDLVIDDPGQKADNTLPAFGASFMRGIASNAIDQAVTPQALLAATGSIPQPARRPSIDHHAQSRQEPQQPAADVHLNWAFFDSPTTFMISLKAGGQADPIKLEMSLRGGMWQVQRVWLPEALLTNSGSPT
nr:DUF2939 domain-containing protein [uncultured Rhodopila sp.]